MNINMRYLLVFILAYFLSNSALANLLHTTKPIEITYQSQVRLDIASEGINRISFDNFFITKLIGNISSFTSVLSDHGSDLFISPKLPVGKRIDFSALLSSGDIIDFSLNVIKSETPCLVKLKLAKSEAIANKSEATAMIEAMHESKIGKYYVQKASTTINISVNPNIKALAQSTYRYGDLQGISMVLENMNRSKSLKIRVNDLLVNFDGVRAIYIEQGFLPPKGKTKAYVVFKGLGV
jgi:hypothetical protein